MRRAGLYAMLLAALALAATDRALARPADQLYPIDLHVVEGEYAWQAYERFQLEWSRPPIADWSYPIAALGYRVRDAAGTVVVRETRLSGDRSRLEVPVPPRPGTYAAEVWLEDEDGERGPTVTTALRYDDKPPGTARTSSPAGWISGNEMVAIAIVAPADPPPVSGIQGYAAAVDRGGETWPCASRNWCGQTDLDLRSPEGGTLSLGTLPEGTSVLRTVAVSGAGVPSAQAVSSVVRVDATRPTVNLHGVPAGWSNGPVALVAEATDSLSGMTAAGPNGPFTAIAVDHAVPRSEPGGLAAVAVAGEGVHRVDAYARDAAGNVDRNAAETSVVSIDETPPSVSFPAAQDPADPERIEATVTDGLSGPDPNRGAIAVREAGSLGAWQPLSTTMAANRLVARWDSDSDPDGIYEFRATAYDRAGNSAASRQRANHTRMVLVNPLKQPVQLQGGISGARGAGSEVLSYGRGTLYRGRLFTAAGAPLRDLPVQIVETFGRGATSPRRSTEVLTAADGTFALRLPPGPSRQVTASFAGTRTLRPATSGASPLAVLTAVSLGASARTARIGGAPVLFSGQVGRHEARLPPGGLPVELQFKVPGGEWREFRTLQTTRRGRFRYAYSFSDDDSRGVRFRFRAYVKGGDWPYEPAASKAVSVTGR